jgi:hypothetical protein
MVNGGDTMGAPDCGSPTSTLGKGQGSLGEQAETADVNRRSQVDRRSTEGTLGGMVSTPEVERCIGDDGLAPTAPCCALPIDRECDPSASRCKIGD